MKPRLGTQAGAARIKVLPDELMSPLFLAAIEATEEADSLFHATSGTGQGFDGRSPAG